MRSRYKPGRQLTVDDLAKLYDTLLRTQNKRYYRRWDMDTSHMGRRKGRQIVQADVRLKRIKDHAEEGSGSRWDSRHSPSVSARKCSRCCTTWSWRPVVSSGN